ncbi:class I SAM-dependent methyltransferase [Fibrobacter sp.]|uniref:class I SAM-dependent methyltransferase n=1 Tax=Fibrobacter sp. TaxID=35828 RepID=UPI003890D14D
MSKNKSSLFSKIWHFFHLPNTDIRKKIKNKFGLDIDFLLEKTVRNLLLDYRNKIEFISKLPNNARILDVGCGNNSPKITKFIKPKSYYVGVDIGDYNQDKGSLEAADEYLLCPPEQFSDTILSANGDFDAVISAHNIEHCNSPFDTLTAMCTKVRKGGKLFMAFPSERSVNFPSRKGTLNFFDDKSHIYLPEFKKILNHIEDSGFEIIYNNSSYRPLGMRLVGMIKDRIIKDRVTGFTWPHYGFEAIIWAKKL